MRTFLTKLTAAPNFIWLLAGLLLASSLVTCLPIVTDSAVFSEERELEIDDDRAEAKHVDFAICDEFEATSTSQTWCNLQVFCFMRFSPEKFKANSERGPPVC